MPDTKVGKINKYFKVWAALKLELVLKTTWCVKLDTMYTLGHTVISKN